MDFVFVYETNRRIDVEGSSGNSYLQFRSEYHIFYCFSQECRIWKIKRNCSTDHEEKQKEKVENRQDGNKGKSLSGHNDGSEKKKL